MADNKTSATPVSSSKIDAVLKRRRASVIEVVDAKSAVDLATAQSYSENVFLFVPNLIGEFTHSVVHATAPLRSVIYYRVAWIRPSGVAPSVMDFRMSRVHSSDPSRARHALHELPPEVFDRRVLHLTTFGCRRRTRSKVSRPGVKVRRSSGYGHRSVCGASPPDSTTLLLRILILPILTVWILGVVNRATTSCLLCYLSSVYPQHALVFQFLIALDFSSHYMHMYR
jgi:hypothetical protein